MEGEIHFLIDCKVYQTERNILFDNIAKLSPNFINLNSAEKFKYLFKSNEANVLTWLGKFIHLSLKYRDEKLKHL